MYVILIYDICLDEKGAKVLNHVFKICKKYLSHIQLSVFEGELSPAQMIQLKGELKKEIRNDRDSVILFKSRQKKWLEKEMMGLRENKAGNFL